MRRARECVDSGGVSTEGSNSGGTNGRGANSGSLMVQMVEARVDANVVRANRGGASTEGSNSGGANGGGASRGGANVDARIVEVQMVDARIEEA